MKLNYLISRFSEDWNKRRRNFLSLSELGYGCWELGWVQESLLAFDKVSEFKWSVYIHYYATFLWPSTSWLLNSLMFQPGWVRYCIQKCDIYAPIPSICNQSIQIYGISIYLSIVIENRYQSITTRIFAINWSSIISINRLIDIVWYWLISIFIDWVWWWGPNFQCSLLFLYYTVWKGRNICLLKRCFNRLQVAKKHFKR